MLLVKKSFDKYGYSLNEISWGNAPMGPTVYQTVWHFFVSFIEKDTNKKIIFDLSLFMTEQESKHPRKVKKELLTAMKGQDIIRCCEILIEKFPDASDYILSKIPDHLCDKVNTNNAVSSAGL